jgi:hypothetical protein
MRRHYRQEELYGDEKEKNEMLRFTRTMMVFAAAIALLAVSGAFAATWNATDAWFDSGWQIQTPWAYMGATMDTGGALSNLSYHPAPYVTTIYADNGYGWGETYWCPRIVKNSGTSTTDYGLQIWTANGDYGHTENVRIAAGAIAIGGNSSFIPQNEAAIRWTATNAGTYSVTATFTGACTTGTSANVGFNLGGVSQWSDAISTYGQATTYTHTFTVTAGQTFDAVVTGRDYVMLDYSITDAPVDTPEPGSMMAMASGLVGLLGFGIRRRKA